MRVTSPVNENRSGFHEKKPILVINQSYPRILRMKKHRIKYALNRWANNILLNQAFLSEGEQLKDPIGFVKA